MEYPSPLSGCFMATLLLLAAAHADDKQDKQPPPIPGAATVTITVDGQTDTQVVPVAPGKVSTFTFSTPDGAATAQGSVLMSTGPAAVGKPVPGVQLGVAVEPVTDELSAKLPAAKGVGLVVRHVVPDSPAAKAGIEPNDVLTQLGDQVLLPTTQLRTLLPDRKPGDKVELTFFRNGEKKTATVVFTGKPAPVAAASSSVSISIGGAPQAGVPATVQQKVIVIGADGQQTVIEGKDGNVDISEALKNAGAAKAMPKATPKTGKE